jgi:hypothetical protein
MTGMASPYSHTRHCQRPTPLPALTPQGFERAVRAHFSLKRDELRAQAVRWAAETRAVAAYEAGLVLQLRAMRETVQAAKQAELVMRAQLQRWKRDHTEVDGYPVFHGSADGRHALPPMEDDVCVVLQVRGEIECFEMWRGPGCTGVTG